MKWKEIVSVVSFLLIPIVFAVGWGIWMSLDQNKMQGTPLETHPQRGWQLPQSGTDPQGHPIHRDANGMRPTKRSGKQNLVYTIGDSSIFGHGLSDEETLHAHLTTEFSQRGISAEAITGAVPGYSSVQSLHQLNTVGWNLKPNLILIGSLWSDNDIITDTQNLEIQEDDSSFWGLNLFLQDSLSQIGLMEGWENKKGFRRVAPTRYAKVLDTIVLEATRRNIGILFLSPCNYALIEEDPGDGYAWDVYFDIMSDVAERRSIPIVVGCDIVNQNKLRGNEAFLDAMHPTSKLNAAYARAIIQILVEKDWPQKSFVLKKPLPLYTKEWKEPWPKVIPEPPNQSGIIRPDNMDLHIK